MRNIRRPDRIIQSPDGSLMLNWFVKDGLLVELEIDEGGSTYWFFPDGVGIDEIKEEGDWE